MAEFMTSTDSLSIHILLTFLLIFLPGSQRILAGAPFPLWLNASMMGLLARSLTRGDPLSLCSVGYKAIVCMSWKDCNVGMGMREQLANFWEFDQCSPLF